jgi:hypothetical protein
MKDKKEVIVFNSETNKLSIYDSLVECAKALDMHPWHLSDYIDKNTWVSKKYFIYFTEDFKTRKNHNSLINIPDGYIRNIVAKERERLDDLIYSLYLKAKPERKRTRIYYVFDDNLVVQKVFNSAKELAQYLDISTGTIKSKNYRINTKEDIIKVGFCSFVKYNEVLSNGK